jgi:dsRNA-specific ribonuclease
MLWTNDSYYKRQNQLKKPKSKLITTSQKRHKPRFQVELESKVPYFCTCDNSMSVFTEHGVFKNI